MESVLNKNEWSKIAEQLLKGLERDNMSLYSIVAGVKDESELITAIKNNFLHLVTKGALTGSLIDDHRNLFTHHDILHNEAGENAYILADGKESVTAMGASFGGYLL